MVRASWVGSALCVLFFAGAAHAQKATERYIPIGESPGLAAPQTMVGQIEAADARSRTLTVSGPDGARTVEISDLTKIWLDKTGLQQSNTVGAFEHCAEGRTIEVKFEEERGDIQPRRAEWLKIRVPPPTR